MRVDTPPSRLTAMDHTVTSRPDELATPSTFHGS